jgi:hypothetical protein
MLLGFLALYLAMEPHTLSLPAMIAKPLAQAPGRAALVLFAFLIGFGVKLPIVPHGMAAEKRAAADVSGGRPGRVAYATDRSHENPRGPAPPTRSAGKTCDNELKLRNDVVPGLRRGIVDPHLKHWESALQLLRAASSAFRRRELGLQSAIDFDRETGSRQFRMGLWHFQLIWMGCRAVHACIFLR